MTDKKRLRIKIFDKEYSLLVENEELAKELADFVNERMDSLRQEMPDQPAQTIAIIASLNLAYELFLERNKNKELHINATDKIKKIKAALDNSSGLVPS